MKRYIVKCMTGYVGMDEHKPLLMSDNHTEADLIDVCWDMAVEHAAAYGVEYSEEFDEGEEDAMINDGIDYFVELYDSKKHDSYRPGGGSFEEDFIEGKC